jgi:hypothetical protein
MVSSRGLHKGRDEAKGLDWSGIRGFEGGLDTGTDRNKEKRFERSHGTCKLEIRISTFSYRATD